MKQSKRTFSFRAMPLLFMMACLPLISFSQAITVSNATGSEGGYLDFTLTHTGAAAPAAFSVTLSFVDGTATGGGTDYPNTSIVVPFSGATGESHIVRIILPEDDIVEGDETLTVYLTGATAGIDLTSKGTGTIHDNDTAHILISDATANEGEGVEFTAKLDKEVKTGFSVNISFVDGKAQTTPTADQKYKDYSNVPQILSFKGKLNEEQKFSVQTNNDIDVLEGDEDFAVTLTPNAGLPYTIAPVTAHGYIRDFTDCKFCPSKIFLDSVQQLTLQFYGDGNLQKTVQSGDAIAASTGVGVYVSKYFKNLPQQKFGLWYRAELMTQINVASSVDTITAKTRTVNNKSVNSNISSFGNSILTPLNSGQAVDIKLRLYNKETFFGVFSGFELHYIGSNRNWKLNSDTVAQISTSMARIAVFHELIPFGKRDNYSVMFRIGYASNWIRGDLGSKDNAEIRKRFIGTDQRTFQGVELGLGLRLKNILGDFSYTMFPEKGNVPGLTGSRLVTTIKFVGGFNIKVD